MRTFEPNQQPQLLVTGGTGAEGLSVARALLKEKKFRVRVLTRSPDSLPARVLQRAGAEIFPGDMLKPATLRKAMEGVEAVFGVTHCGEEYDKEFEMGKHLIDAVEEAGVSHFVFKSMPSYQKLSNGKFPVPPYDVKAELENYACKKKLPATFIRPALYYESFLRQFPLQKDNNGGYYFGFPQGDTRLAMVAVEDLGKMVAVVLNDPESFIGKTIGLVGADLRCEEYASVLSGLLQRTIYYSYIPRNTYAAYDFPGAVDWANLFEVQRLHIHHRQGDMLETYRLLPGARTFESWVEKNRDQFLGYFNSLFDVIVI